MYSSTSAFRWCFAVFAGIGSVALTGCGIRDSAQVQAATQKAQYRPFEGRIYGAPYAPWSKTNAQLSTQITEQGFREIYSHSSEPEELRARAALRAGNVRYAKPLLEKITSRGNASAETWSNYSAALHADAAPDDTFILATALAAADHALDIDPSLPEALFNRALTLEAMSLRGPAIAAYAKYLEIDTASSWRPEVQSRLEKLESSARSAEKSRHAIARAAASEDELLINDTAIAFPQDSRHWAEGPFLGGWAEDILKKDAAGAASMLKHCRVIGRALETQFGDGFLSDTVRAIDRSADPKELAHAHIAYVRGRVAFAQRNLATAIPALEEARRRFDAQGSPMALLAQLYLTMLSFDTGSADRTPSMLRDLSRRVPERYGALRAEIQWLEARSATASGKTNTALKLYRSAGAAFTALGEQRSAAITREMETILLGNVGRTAEAWRLRHATLVWTTEAGDDLHLPYTLYGAARDAILASRWDLAHALLNAFIETGGSGRRRDEVLAWRAIAAQRAGMSRTASDEERAAHVAERQLDELTLVQALLARKPSEGLRLLDEPLKTAEQQGNKAAVSQLLVERARLLRAAGQPARAHSDLERAVALLDGDPSSVSSRTIRDAFLGTPDRAFCLFADSLDARGETEQALDTLELLKARLDGDSSQFSKLIPFHFPQSLPPGVLLITYGVFDDRLVIYARNSLQLTRATVAVKRSQVEQLVSAFDQAIAQNDRVAFENTGRSLGQILVEPIAKQAATADTLVFVRDHAFGNLPFSALASHSKRFLIEDFAVVVTPSTRSYLRASHTKTATSRALLSVGNALSGERSDPLPALAAAESEAKEIAAMYPSHALLVEDDATKARVMGALPYCDAAHFAVHANAGLGDTMPPHLILTRTADSEGILMAPEIASLRLDGVRIVVLAGCNTAASSARSRTDSLINAFLAAGAGSVIGTLWNVEDAPTRTMSIAIHRELLKGSSPARALRTTQLEMIRSRVAPSVWASMQLYGSGR